MISTRINTFKDSTFAQNQGRILGWYLVVYITYSLLVWIFPIAAILNLQPFTGPLFVLVGAVLLVTDLCTHQSILKIPCWFCFPAFLIIALISSLLNIQYGWVENAKTLVWQIIQFGIFVPLCVILTKKEARYFFTIVFWVVFLIVSSACLVGVIEFLFQIDMGIPVSEAKTQYQGFADARLYGPYIDPNYGACLVVVVALMTLYFIRSSAPTRRVCCFLWAALAFDFLYFIGSASRTGAICAAVAFIVVAALFLRNTRQQADRERRRKAYAITALIAVVLVASNVVGEAAFSSYASWYHENVTSGEGRFLDSDSFKAGRVDTSIENISNNRFAIWEDYIRYSGDSLIFGKSPNTALEQIIEKHPDSYLAYKLYLTHNGYLTIFVTTGVLGLGIWILVALRLFAGLFSYLRKKRQIDDSTLLCLALFMVICTKTFFFSTLFFNTNIDATFFYIALGMLLVRFKDTKAGSQDRAVEQSAGL